MSAKGETSNTVQLTEDFLQHANALIGEQPESHRDNYAAALMQATNAYYQFFLEGGETDQQKYSMELFEKNIQNIFNKPTDKAA